LCAKHVCLSARNSIKSSPKRSKRSLAETSQTCTTLRCTGLSDVHETVSGAQAGALSELATLGKTLGAATIIHRTVRCASHAPSQRSVARSAGDTWTSPTVTRAHRTVRCATGSVAATVGFAEKEGNQALFTVRRASHAPSQRSRATSGDAWTSPTVTRAHQTVRCATGLVAAMISFARKGRKSGTIHCPVVHRTVRCGSHAPSQRSIARSAGDTWTSPTVTRAHRTVRCSTGPVAATAGFARKGRKSGTIHCLVVHRTVRCASHALSQRSVARSAGDTWTSPTVTRAHRIVRCATRPVAAMVGFAKKGRKSGTIHCPVVHRTVRCASHAPSQRSIARLAGDTWTSPTVTRAHRTVRCATRSVAATVSFARKGRKSGTIHCTVVHRTVRCASHAPSQRSVARSAGDTWTSPMVTRAHRTVLCAMGPVAATVDFTRKGRKSDTIHCPVVRCASHAPSQRSVARSAGDTWTSPIGHQGAPDCPVCHGAGGCNSRLR
jgi:hypothetical protein